MSMKNEFGGKVVGSDDGGLLGAWSVLVEHNGERFTVIVWAQNRQHAIARLAVVASARYFYRILAVNRPYPLEVNTSEPYVSGSVSGSL